MKIDISTTKFKECYSLIDEADEEWVCLWKWCPKLSSENGNLYVVRSHDGRPVYLHRQIARARFYEQVDHINGDTLDNRRANLRICSNAQNQQNRKKKLPGKGGTRFKGVFFINGRWRAYITVNKKRYHLGVYDAEIDAAKEYDSKALHYFGRFARLNFPVEETTPSEIVKSGIVVSRKDAA